MAPPDPPLGDARDSDALDLGDAVCSDMAGPVFRFVYLRGAAPQQGELARALKGLGLVVRVESATELALHGEGVGSLYVGVDDARDFADRPEAERRALERALGGAPEREICGYAMANQPADWAALRRIAVRVAERFGGWWTTDRASELPWLHSTPDGGVIAVEHRDVAGFFGPMLADADYVRQNLPFVPVRTEWFVDARLAAFTAVRK